MVPPPVPPRLARFPVHGYEVDAFDELALPALSGYLQEAAAAHADELGCGLEALRARGLTWVLIRQRIEVARPIRLGDELTITTWPSGIDRLLVARQFSVTCRDVEVARSSTAWVLLDVATRRPVRPADALAPILRPRSEPLLPLAARLEPPGPDAGERRFEVRFQEIDANLHVNNAAYVAWAVESISAERWRSRRPCAVEVHYLAEARHGEAVTSRVSGDGDELRHSIVRDGDGKELARLRTSWAGR
jgi:acyl-ACP thioesterase